MGENENPPQFHFSPNGDISYIICKQLLQQRYFLPPPTSPPCLFSPFYLLFCFVFASSGMGQNAILWLYRDTTKHTWHFHLMWIKIKLQDWRGGKLYFCQMAKMLPIQEHWSGTFHSSTTAGGKAFFPVLSPFCCAVRFDWDAPDALLLKAAL